MHTRGMIEVHHEFKDDLMIGSSELEHRSAPLLTSHDKSIAATVASEPEVIATE